MTESQRMALAGLLSQASKALAEAGQLLAAPESAPAPPLETLSRRELEVLQHLASGRSQPQVASILDVSSKTVETYSRRIGQKVGLQGVRALAAFGRRYGLGG